MHHRCWSTVLRVATRSDLSTLYWIGAVRDRWSGPPEDWNFERKLRIRMRKRSNLSRAAALLLLRVPPF